jgi:hypothetical protein
MPTTWVVSSHASTYGQGASKTFKLVQLPSGVRFYFFCKEGTGLPVDRGWQAYNLCMKSQPTSADLIALTQITDYQMFDKPALPDYAITGDNGWIDSNGLSASGIFMFGDTLHQDQRTVYIQAGQWTSLSKFISLRTWKPGDQVYWLCCRCWQ